VQETPCAGHVETMRCADIRESFVVTSIVIVSTLAFCAVWSAFFPFPPPRLLMAARTARPAPASRPGLTSPPAEQQQQHDAHKVEVHLKLETGCHNEHATRHATPAPIFELHVDAAT
jgi:ABC-type nickel/cobalt efflux system permease component RcnA